MSEIVIFQRDIDVLEENAPSQERGISEVVNVGCEHYAKARPLLEKVLPMLAWLHPPGEAAAKVALALLDKVCASVPAGDPPG